MDRNIDEICRNSKELHIKYEVLSKSTSIKIINEVFLKYKVAKKFNHLAIYSEDSINIATEKYQFTYSTYLNNEPIYVFFDQKNHNKDQVILIEDGRRLSELMKNSYGMEYFVTNELFDYLLAVNWYVIEGVGSVKNWMKSLAGD